MNDMQTGSATYGAPRHARPFGYAGRHRAPAQTSSPVQPEQVKPLAALVGALRRTGNGA